MRRTDWRDRFHKIRAIGVIACERFMAMRAGYGGCHSVPAVSYRLKRSRYFKPGRYSRRYRRVRPASRWADRPVFAYELRRPRRPRPDPRPKKVLPLIPTAPAVRRPSEWKLAA
jgi:hypothetical protein